MKEIKLNRTGRRPLGFVGNEIYNGSTRDHQSTRWDVVRIFETADGYVVGLARITCMENEKDFFQVRKFKTKDDVIAFSKKRLGYLEKLIIAALQTNVSA